MRSIRELIVYAVIFYLARLFLVCHPIRCRRFAGQPYGRARPSRYADYISLARPVSISASSGLRNPNGSIEVIASFIPFFTPFIMFLRIGMSNPAIWEVWLSIAGLLCCDSRLRWLSAKIYRTGVLMYGKRPTMKELIKAMKAYKV